MNMSAVTMQPYFPHPPMMQNNVMLGKSYPTLYVGDLEEQITEDYLYNYFSKFGNLFSVKVMRESQSKKSRGFAFVSFYQQKDAEQAKAAANHDRILKNEIRVTWKKVPKDFSSEANVFIKNLDPEATVSHLDTALNKYGPIFSSKIARSESGMSLGYGYVQFETTEGAKKCIEDSANVKINGKDVVVSAFLSKKNRADSRKNLYIKNFPAGKSEEEIRGYLEALCGKYGKVSSLMVTIDKTTERAYAFVCFDSNLDAEEAFKALQEIDPFSAGEKLYVNWAEKKGERIKKLREVYSTTFNETNLFTKNLKDTVTEEQLMSAYSQFGEVTSVSVRTPAEVIPERKITKFGFINFRTKEAAREALHKAVASESVQALYEFSNGAGVPLFFHMKRDQYSLYKETKKRSVRFNQQPQMMMEQYNPYMMPPQMMMRGNPVGVPMRGEFYQQMPMGGFVGGMNRGMPMKQGNMRQGNNQGYKKQGPAGPRGQNVQAGGPRGQYQKPQTQRPPVQQKPAQEEQVTVSAEYFKTRLSEFVKFDKEKQRRLLGEALFPLINKFATADYAPKITGMLIDFDVFEVSEIIEFIENEEVLKERVVEAEELIRNNTN